MYNFILILGKQNPLAHLIYGYTSLGRSKTEMERKERGLRQGHDKSCFTECVVILFILSSRGVL